MVDGWLVVPYPRPNSDFARVALAVTNMREPTGGEWKSAFLDYDQGERVAKARFPDLLGPTSMVWMRVNGHARRVK